MKKIAAVVLLTLVFAPATLFAKQTKLTTYYPAPYGDYTTLKSSDLQTNYLKLNPTATAPAGENGQIYYKDGSGFQFYQNGWQIWGTALGGFDLKKVEQYSGSTDNTNPGGGLVILADNTNNLTARNKDKYKKGGVLIGGHITGYQASTCQIIADDVTKNFSFILAEIEEKPNAGTDYHSGTIPGPIRFNESIKITYTDAAPNDGSCTAGSVFIVWDD